MKMTGALRGISPDSKVSTTRRWIVRGVKCKRRLCMPGLFIAGAQAYRPGDAAFIDG
jgi:hypothetical protein